MACAFHSWNPSQETIGQTLALWTSCSAFGQPIQKHGMCQSISLPPLQTVSRHQWLRQSPRYPSCEVLDPGRETGHIFGSWRGSVLPTHQACLQKPQRHYRARSISGSRLQIILTTDKPRGDVQTLSAFPIGMGPSKTDLTQYQEGAVLVSQQLPHRCPPSRDELKCKER